MDKDADGRTMATVRNVTLIYYSHKCKQEPKVKMSRISGKQDQRPLFVLLSYNTLGDMQITMLLLIRSSFWDGASSRPCEQDYRLRPRRHPPPASASSRSSKLCYNQRWYAVSICCGIGQLFRRTCDFCSPLVVHACAWAVPPPPQRTRPWVETQTSKDQPLGGRPLQPYP